MTEDDPRPSDDLPQEFLSALEAVSSKRAQTVIQHILEHGHITTEELSTTYGYDHPPRAARDVRESGIPLETFRVKGTHGRRVGAYRFGDPSKVRRGRLGGRKAFPKSLKTDLAETSGKRCEICLVDLELRYLQIDHRVPYEVYGDEEDGFSVERFMLLCGSCNRAKSWSCENCSNWTDGHEIDVCQSCYWASPENYSHVAQAAIRRMDVTWSGSEVLDYDRLVALAQQDGSRLPAFVKGVLRDTLGRHGVTSEDGGDADGHD